MLRTIGDEILAGLMRCIGRRNRRPRAFIHKLGGRQRFYGEAVTVKCFEDKFKVKELVDTASNNLVMVVYGGGSLRRALLGDMITANALANGWVGFVFMAQFSMWMSSV